MQLDLVDPKSPDVERTWRELDAQNPRSYFLSWGWVENWLASLPRARLPELAIIREDGRAISAFFFSRRLIRRHRVLPSRAIYFNTTGIESFDDLWIEYNGLVGRDLDLPTIVRLLPGRWDELFLNGLRSDAFGGIEGEPELSRTRIRVDRKVPAHYVDLARVRAQGYLAALGSQTRGQVRRAQREAGDTTLDVAETESTALEIYDELVHLHSRQWQAKGKPGAFADPWFDAFHRRLIAQRFRHGEIQLLRVRGATRTLGCLYNFVYRGRVLQYQSGFVQLENKHLKPGFVTHAAAIEHAGALGHDVYDFLGGDMRYKKSLSTDCGWLLWARVQRIALRFMLEDRLRGWVASRRAPVVSAD